MARSLTSLTVFDTLAVDVCRTIRYRHHLTALTGNTVWLIVASASCVQVATTSSTVRAHVISQPGHLRLLMSAAREMSTGQTAAAVLFGREGNRRSGFALATRH